MKTKKIQYNSTSSRNGINRQLNGSVSWEGPSSKRTCTVFFKFVVFFFLLSYKSILFFSVYYFLLSKRDFVCYPMKTICKKKKGSYLLAFLLSICLVPKDTSRTEHYCTIVKVVRHQFSMRFSEHGISDLIEKVNHSFNGMIINYKTFIERRDMKEENSFRYILLNVVFHYQDFII